MTYGSRQGGGLSGRGCQPLQRLTVQGQQGFQTDPWAQGLCLSSLTSVTRRAVAAVPTSQSKSFRLAHQAGTCPSHQSGKLLVLGSGRGKTQNSETGSDTPMSHSKLGPCILASSGHVSPSLGELQQEGRPSLIWHSAWHHMACQANGIFCTLMSHFSKTLAGSSFPVSL